MAEVRSVRTLPEPGWGPPPASGGEPGHYASVAVEPRGRRGVRRRARGRAAVRSPAHEVRPTRERPDSPNRGVPARPSIYGDRPTGGKGLAQSPPAARLTGAAPSWGSRFPSPALPRAISCRRRRGRAESRFIRSAASGASCIGDAGVWPPRSSRVRRRPRCHCWHGRKACRPAPSGSVMPC